MSIVPHKSVSIDLAPHQLKALGEMHNGSVLKGGVGTGKSRTALAYYFNKVCGGSLEIDSFGLPGEFAKPKDIYIITTAKKRDSLDWEEEALAFRIGRDSEVSWGGVQLVVDSWNSITEYSEISGAFFIFDEQRLVGSGAWVKAFLQIAKNNEWIILSATPGDTWMDYIPIFLANGFYKNRTEFIREHVIYKPFSKFPKIDRIIGQAKLESLRRKVLVEMPYARHTTRHVLQIMVGYDELLFDRVVVDRWHVYEDRPLKDIGEMFAVMRKVVNSDPSRLGAVMELMEKHPKLIIFYNFNYELDALRILMQTLNQTYSEWNGQKHEAIPSADSWVYLVQYTAGAEGWNCIETDSVIFYSLNYSWKINEQAKGRTDRLNTPFKDLYYYILRSNSKIDISINKAIATKRNFNESDLGIDWELAA
jgi:hypothetical protein